MFKRKTRKHRKESRRPAHGELAEFLAGWELLHELASVFPHWEPGDRGRPPDLPPAALLLFGIMCIECGSDRKAEAQLRYEPTWQAVRTSLTARYPHYRGLRSTAQSISRREFWRFREKYGIASEVLDELRDAFRSVTATIARDHGMFDPSHGSFTHPALENMLVGDGTVVAPRYKGTPTGQQLNRETGELEHVKFDPDANFYKTGDGENAYGLKFGFIEARLPHHNERIILDVFSIANEAGHDEAAEAVRSITAIHEHLPGAQAISWDMALRGIHFDTTRALGLVDIVKVHKTAARKGNKIPAPPGANGNRRSGHVFDLIDGSQDELELFTLDGHPHIEFIAEGQVGMLPLRKTRNRRVAQRTGGYRWYGDYRVPDHAVVPERLRGATVSIRFDRTEYDGPYNRAEHLRMITKHDAVVGPNADPEHTSEFEQLYVLRPGSESTNRWVKGHFSDKRSPAVGIPRTHFMLICGALLNNARAVLARQARLKQAA